MGAASTDQGPGALTRHLQEIGLRPEGLDLRLGEMIELGLAPGEARDASRHVWSDLKTQRRSIAQGSMGELLALFR